jgi:dihydrofolate reductase
MARLIYSAITSLDGYVNDERGEFGWAQPDEEVHVFINDSERGTGTYLFGRRLYETMVIWETMDHPHPVMRDYAEIWRSAEKVVYSTTLDEVSSERTRLEREFDPEAVRSLVASAERDVSVGGAGLAAAALEAGLVDELRLTVAPAVVGGGTRWLPDGIGLALELLDEGRFASGFAHLRYGVTR